ncbi:MAG: LD-carboxypeptidase [Lachnospiraceae bacterium]|nr:LD-carboxypeptidase [Lachnospiraceae bacterium]
MIVQQAHSLPLLAEGDQVALVCCSNGQRRQNEGLIKQLEEVLQQAGLLPVSSPFLYEKDSVFSGTGKERAEILMQFYQENTIQAVFDLSGGDIANEILPYLDYEIIARSDKTFWGYSDLTTIVNAIYAKTGKASVLYQIRNLVSRDGTGQRENWIRTAFHGEDALFAFPYQMIQGEWMQGIVVGGNIRCLLKLAGTEYWPDMTGKVLLLEALHGKVPQMVTYLNQLKQIGVFQQINGILLGTFTQMEEENIQPGIIELVKQYAGTEISIAKTDKIGHGTDSRAIMIGREIRCATDRNERRCIYA